MSQFPSPEKIIKEWINGRANAGVVLAQAVTEVESNNGHMVITVETLHFRRSNEWPAAVAPFQGNIEEFYATEFGLTNAQGAYLRSQISTLEVQDHKGRPIGNLLDTTSFQIRKNPPQDLN
ncbi:hypothetical protein ACXZ66_04365 [Corynebacterium sp. S7]